MTSNIHFCCNYINYVFKNSIYCSDTYIYDLIFITVNSVNTELITDLYSVMNLYNFLEDHIFAFIV